MGAALDEEFYGRVRRFSGKIVKVDGEATAAVPLQPRVQGLAAREFFRLPEHAVCGRVVKKFFVVFKQNGQEFVNSRYNAACRSEMFARE